MLFLTLECLFSYGGSAKSSEPGNTFVSSENHLSVFTAFSCDSVFSVQLPVLSTRGFCRFKLSSLHRSAGATSVQAGDPFESATL